MRERDPFEMPEDTRLLAQAILKPTNHYRVIAEQAPDVVTDDQFAQMYEPTGRIAITPSMLALVTVFQSNVGEMAELKSPGPACHQAAVPALAA